ncbi:MAG: carbon starvation protein A [Gemmatales bacterium]
MPLFANLFYEESASGIMLRAMPILLFVLAVFAIAYRYYSAFLAAKVLALDDKNITPAHRFKDGKDYDPTNKWVLFGHHFAAISGAGPLIGPVLAIQYGYAPGLLWLVVGVCLAGAVQDMMVLAGSVRCNGKSLGEMAKQELGPWASYILSLATVVIVILALAGLGFVVVKALGGEEVKYAEGTVIYIPKSIPALLPDFNQPKQMRQVKLLDTVAVGDKTLVTFPGNCTIAYPGLKQNVRRAEGFKVLVSEVKWVEQGGVRLPANSIEQVPGSSWGLFTIAATIPIAFLVGFYMYRLRPGKVLEASILGGVLVIAATIAGAWIPGSVLEPWFSLTKTQTVWAICIYGFVASVLPVWMLLLPRDYISSFLKIGTIALLIVGTLLANPVLAHPPINPVFQEAGPTFNGSLFPFVFICIMCGAISGFHALVSSGTTPKMVDKETQVRTIGYGAMLMEGIVGVIALIAAAALPVPLYYDINIALADVGKYQPQLVKLYDDLGLNTPAAKDPMHQAQVESVHHLNLAQVEEMVGGEALRGRTGGAVTLAVSMALIFTEALKWTALPVQAVVKYWYHFAIMFEALFILTTIDAGTRIARFILQDALGKIIPKFGETNWLPGSILATFLVTLGWGWLVAAGSIQTIWSMFGIANQLLAVAALAVVTSMLVNRGKGRYAWLTLLPMLFVTTTTMYAGSLLIRRFMTTDNWLNFGLTLFVMTTVGLLLLIAAAHWLKVLMKK